MNNVARAKNEMERLLLTLIEREGLTIAETFWVLGRLTTEHAELVVRDERAFAKKEPTK